MIVETPPQPRKHRSHGNPEAKIQAECVTWLWNNKPETRGLYFCVPNENTQSVYETKRQQMISGSKRKAMGLVSGVSDTILLLPRRGYHALCIEFKTPVGRQSDAQISWESLVRANGYGYTVCRSLDDFKYIINWYLK